MLLQRNGIKVAYAMRGQGAPLMVMSGDSALHSFHLRGWFAGLDCAGQVICYAPADDMAPAHTTGAIDSELDYWFTATNALQEHLGHTEIFLCGHGYGGFLAQEYALRYGQSLAGLILCATAPALDYRNENVNRLSALTTPVLIIAGRLDWYTPPHQAERLHMALPAAQLVIFDQSGHFPFITEQARFSTVVARWIAAQVK